MRYSEVIKNKSTQWILLHISRVKFHGNSNCFGGKTHSDTEKNPPIVCSFYAPPARSGQTVNFLFSLSP